MTLFQPDRCLILAPRRRRASAHFGGCIPPQPAAEELKHPEKLATRAPSCCDTSKHRATRGDI